MDAVVGDRVRWQAVHDEGVIEQVEPRRNLLFRQDAVRSKTFAANIDQVVIFLAARPALAENLLARTLIACEASGIPPLIVLNKADLEPAFQQAIEKLQTHVDMGYTVLPLSAGGPPSPLSESRLQALRRQLAGKINLLLGPSGSGKSTLINRLLPNAGAAVGALSEALQKGRHTTTRSTWYWLDRDAGDALIDSPGFQTFGLAHLDPTQLAACMPDLRSHARACRFHNCSHRHEPDCGVRAAMRDGIISAGRYAIYAQLWEELNQLRGAES